MGQAKAIDSFGPGKSFGAGVVLSGANPKNLVLAAGAAVTIAQTGISTGEQAKLIGDGISGLS